jgi:anti-sigma regulatory factor (Ser/Thr protein kinase)
VPRGARRRGLRARAVPEAAPPEHEVPDHAALAESGRGFAIMSACVDEVTLRTAPGRGTRVVLDKRIAWDPPLARSA